MSRERTKYEQRVGTVVDGKWRLERLLGWGSTSAVYEAMHRNGNVAALKILHLSLCGESVAVERFLREAYVANAIKHRAVVPVRDDGTTEDGCAYLVLELLEGETLEQRRERQNGRLSLDELMPIADELMSCVSGIHGAGFVHRDLKPQNIFLTTSGEVKILDFGTARAFDATKESISVQGLVIGTPSFMSPEQARGDHAAVDVLSDQWAIGAVLFSSLTGEFVHPGRDPHQRLLAAASQKARSITELGCVIDTRLAGVIDRALLADKSKRWPDLEAMRKEFVSAAEEAAPMMRRFERDRSVPPPALATPSALPPALIIPTPASFASMPVVVEREPAPPPKRGGIGIYLGVAAGLAAGLAIFVFVQSGDGPEAAKKGGSQVVVAPVETARPIATIPPPARVEVDRAAPTATAAVSVTAPRARRRDGGGAVEGPVDELDDVAPLLPQAPLSPQAPAVSGKTPASASASPPAADPPAAKEAPAKDPAEPPARPTTAQKTDIDIEQP